MISKKFASGALLIRSSKSGFALVVTLSLMLLLSLVAVGLLTLGSIAARGGSSDVGIARANARIALILAIGELQKHAGPDQRVTAKAEILGNPANTEPSADSPVASDVLNPHWVGVWRTDRLKGESAPPVAPLIHRDLNVIGQKQGTLADRRSLPGVYAAETQVLQWFVSNPDPNNALDPLGWQPPRDSPVVLGNQGSTADFLVKVPAVPLANQQGKQQGSLAWWVSDESVKARFDLSVPQKSPAKEYAGVVPPVSGIGQVTGMGGYESVPPAEIDRVVSAKSIDLLENRMADVQDEGKERFHAVTVSSMGVLSDSLNGGLKRDLGTILRTGAATALGTKRPAIDATTPFFNSPKLVEVSPKYGLLMSWAQLAEKAQGSGTPSLDPQLAETKGSLINHIYPGGSSTLSAGIDLRAQTKVGIHPVLADASASYGASLLKDPASDRYGFRIHISPHIVLWNPYNVKLNSADYAVQLALSPSIDVVPYKAGGRMDSYTRRVRANTPPMAALDSGTGTNSPLRPCFLLPSVTLAPGEAVLFTCQSGQHTNWTTAGNKLSDFQLVANADQPLNGSFYFDVIGQGGNEYPIPAAERDTLDYVLESPPSGFFAHSWAKLGLARDSAADCKTGWADSGKIAPLQYINESEDGANASDAAFQTGLANGAIPIDANPLGITPGTEGGMAPNSWFPYIRLKYGRRMMWLEEMQRNRQQLFAYNPIYVNYNLIANHNVRSSWSHRSAFENVFRIGGLARQWGGYQMSQRVDDPYEWDWSDSMLSPTREGNKNRVSPFGAPASFGSSVYPMFQVPSKSAPLLSLGMLQHVPLSPFRWHPSYAVGNSLADPRVPRDSTTNYVPPANWNFNGGGTTPHPYNWTTLLQNLDQSIHYDLSFEANHALWDPYFISSVPAPLPGTGILPNPRMVPRASFTIPSVATDLANPNRAARQLLVAGAFNVNSTSVDAWEALFTSFKANPQLRIKTNDGGEIDAANVFSRLVNPDGDDANGAQYSDASMWNGYRVLTDQEVRRLAEEAVRQVKIRGPFLSVADFVNRRLVKPPSAGNPSAETEFTKTGLKGALQEAIDLTEINQHIVDEARFRIEKTEYNANIPQHWDQADYGTKYPDLIHPTSSSAHFGPKPDHMHWPESKLTGAPGFLTQADILQKLGPVLTARGDTFVIRAYGDSRDPATGVIRASVRLEAVVQRTPDPLIPDAYGLDPLLPSAANNAEWGRKFVIQSMRWLNPEEV